MEILAMLKIIIKEIYIIYFGQTLFMYPLYFRLVLKRQKL